MNHTPLTRVCLTCRWATDIATRRQGEARQSKVSITPALAGQGILRYWIKSDLEFDFPPGFPFWGSVFRCAQVGTCSKATPITSFCNTIGEVVDNISSKSFNPFHELDLEALSYHIKMSVVPYIEDSISLASQQNTKISQGILYKHTIPASLRKKPILKAAAKVRYWIVFKIENLAEIISQLPDYQEFTVDRKREYLKFALEDIIIGNNDFFKDVYKLPIMDRSDPKNEWIATEKYRKLSHEWAIVVKDAVNDNFENNYSKLWLMLTPSKTGTFSLLTDGIKVYLPKFIENQKEEEEEDADFKCRPGTSWKEIKISLVSNEMIIIQTPTWQKRFTFHKLGLADGRKGDSPTIPWIRLIQLCENNGVLNDNLCNDSKSKNLDSQLRVLAKKFKLLLEINDRFRYYSKGRQLYVALPQFEDKREGNRTTDKPEESSSYQKNLLNAYRKARPEKF